MHRRTPSRYAAPAADPTGGGRVDRFPGDQLLPQMIIDNGLSLTNMTAYSDKVLRAQLLLIALTIDRPLRRLRRNAERPGHRDTSSDDDAPAPEVPEFAR